MSRFFLGLDSSTQSLSAIVIDYDIRKVVYESSVNFDEALPHYGTVNGALRMEDPTVVHAPPLMWVEALDLLLARMQHDGVPTGDILAVSGSGQQHGSVYLNSTAAGALANLEAGSSLRDNLSGIFSRDTSPIWMDSSTARECREIEQAIGGTQAMAQATGSAAFERFTGPQIRKFAHADPDAYGKTSKIALVSSFLASVLAGRIAPIDHGDGAGMNLMDIERKDWHPWSVRATAQGLEDRLPELSNPWKIIGPLHPYFGKYGFSASTLCGAWSGDNPSSLIGLGLTEPGIVAISLGTSYTYFGTMKQCRVDPRGEGHVFISPTGEYMSLICFKNGALAREKLRERFGLDRDGFSKAIDSTPPGNNGGFMLPYFEPEIVPKVLHPGVRRIDLSETDAGANCRAVCESQMISMKIHSEWMGVTPTKIYATGGASADRVFLKIIADVFQCPVYRQELSNSAALGAALRAAHAWLAHKEKEVRWDEIVAGFCDPIEGTRIEPDAQLSDTYTAMQKSYTNAEKRYLGSE